MIRTFIAINLPDPVKKTISMFQHDASGDGFNVRWVKPENVHITIKFIGDIPQDLADRIKDEVFSAPPLYKSFALACGGTGVFPNLKRPRVFWAGITKGVKELTEIAEIVDDRLAALSISRENRPFRAHVTIGRFSRSPEDRAIRQFVSSELLSTEDISVNKMTFMKSELKREGPEYSVLAEHNFYETKVN